MQNIHCIICTKENNMEQNDIKFALFGSQKGIEYDLSLSQVQRDIGTIFGLL